MTPTETLPEGRRRAMRQAAAVLAAFIAVALSLSEPSWAQDVASSAVAVTPAAAPEPPVNFSLLGLFLSADWIVKIVMIGLLGASIWCWAIIIDKSMLYGRANRQMNAFERVFWSGQSLEDLYQQMQERPSMGLGAIFVAAMKEWKRSHEQNAASFIGVQARLDKVLDVAIARESDGLERRLSFLATVASASPFIGLFGTVWGIMNSFTSIAASKSTNLAVVAPGIAEALFATALGLLAAIPATIAYNKLSADANKLISRLESFADEFATILSRQLEARSR
ncbi:MAG TPA: protein TolQ [Devosia sp.]|nr:protein TolQ [Devosia sp.]